MDRIRIAFRRALTDGRVRCLGPREPSPLQRTCSHQIVVQSESASWCGLCGKQAF